MMHRPVRRIFMFKNFLIYLTKKSVSPKGISRLALVLLVAIGILLVLISIPIYREAEERGKVRMDKGHEQTAWDSAYMKYMLEGGPFTAIYDSENKEFVYRVESMREFDRITAYGESKENIGKVILLNVSKDGEINVKWIGREEYRKVNHGD